MNYLKKGLLCIALSYCLILQGCSLAWIGTLDTVLAAAAPALNNVLTIISLAQNKPVNTVLEAKITADAANLKTLAADFAAASGSTAPTACQELQAGVNVLNDDAATVLALVQASGSNNVQAIFAAADAFVVVIVGLIPQCASPAAISASKKLVVARVAGIDANAMVSHYNQVLTKPSGSAVIDSYAKSHQVHAHSKFMRVLSFGHQK